MYNDFYNFKESPFSVTADPDFFFPSENHREAFSHLVYGIEQRKGILLITGEIGTGKTTLCRTLLSKLDNNVKTAFILNPNFSDVQMLRLIIKDFGIKGTFRNKFELIDGLNDFLIEETNQGNNLVLIIDEAQNIKEKQLEQIRLLSNLETEKDKLLQIILVGQPELCDKLKLSSLRQLEQRIMVKYHILPLGKKETKKYINHRIQCAKASEDANEKNPDFAEDALDVIYDLTQGTPRLINILCDRVLLAGFVKENREITKGTVYKCARETIRK